MAGNTSLFDEKQLHSYKKDQLVELVMQLQKEKVDLQQQSECPLEKRVIAIERSQFLYEQYGRRESIEISGIPKDVQTKDLETEVIRIYNEAKVLVHEKPLEPLDIASCHRIGKKGQQLFVAS